MMNQLGMVTLVDVEFDLYNERVTMTTDTVTVDGCDFSRSEGSPILSLANRTAVSFNHIVKNSTFSQDLSLNDVASVSSDYDRDSNNFSTLEINNCAFSASTSAAKMFCEMELSGSFTYHVDLELINNEFTDMRLFIDDSPTLEVILNIDYDGNNSDVEVCPEDLLSQSGTSVDPSWNIEEWYYTWLYNNFAVYGDSLEIGRLVSVYCNVAYVQFKPGGGLAADAIVIYGDDVVAGNTADAWINRSTGYFNSSFSVEDFMLDRDFHWKPQTTLCDSTETGDDVAKTFRPNFGCGGGGGHPPWFEEQPGEGFTGGEGGKEEPELEPPTDD